jgi:hypothetical protein
MRTTSRLIAFALGLGAVLGLGALLGAAVGPDATAPEEAAPPPEGEGVVTTVDGYRMVALDPVLDPDGGPFRFVIEDPSGTAEQEYSEMHERDLHLIVVDRDLTDFHHVHPDLDGDGTWSVELPALAAGSYRAIADFQVSDGPRLALGTDLSVPGDYEPAPREEPAATTSVDGYDVTLATEAGEGGEVTATLEVLRAGEVVAPEPYLGARGHLVALRTGDLAYAHVHPIEEEGDDAVRFDATLPSAGRYGLFFDFRLDGEVHTASFTFDQGEVTGTTEGMEH